MLHKFIEIIDGFKSSLREISWIFLGLFDFLEIYIKIPSGIWKTFKDLKWF